MNSSTNDSICDLMAENGNLKIAIMEAVKSWDKLYYLCRTQDESFYRYNEKMDELRNMEIDDRYCNFCEKHQSDVSILIHENNTYICNECVAVCVEIICKNINRRGGYENKPQ